MQKIFKNKKEPLYGRNTVELRVKPFKPSVLKQIMADAKPGYTKEDLQATHEFKKYKTSYKGLSMEEM